MKLSEAATVMKGGLRGDDAYFYGASSDTRQLKPGEIFFAWEGAHSDAHQFLDSAEAKGAIAAVVEHYVLSSEISQIQVQDSQRSLGLLAKEWRKRWQGQLIALTGSNGKTTLKEMLHSILTGVDNTLATEGNYNNHVGCPLTLLQLSKNHRLAVIEMGANHPHEIEYLTDIARPNIAIINNAGACHLEGFGSLQGVAEAKAEIFQGLDKLGIAIINADDQFASLWKEKAKGHDQLTFGINNSADCYATDINGSQFKLNFKDRSILIELNLLGRHNIMNALAAATATIALKTPLELIKVGLESLMPVSGRLEKIPYNTHVTLINDGYNANPNSLRAGIDSLTDQHHWLVLGDMGELGEAREALHFESGEYAKENQIEAIFTLGELARNAAEGFGDLTHCYQDHDSLIDQLRLEIKEFNQSYPDQSLTILVKGSNSMKMPIIINKLLHES